MVWLAPEFIVYVTVAFGVPLKAIVVIAPEQIVAVPKMEADGNAATVTIALPVCV